MIQAGTEMVALSGLILDLDARELRVGFLLSDGSEAATWWTIADLQRYCGVIGPPQRAPAGAVVQ